MRAFICIVMAVLLTNVQVALAESTAPKMIPTMNLVEELSRAESVKNITELVARDEVRAELEKVGLTTSEVTKRLASLSDSEIRDLNKQLDQARYGGSVGGILVLVVLVLLIIFLAKRV